MKNLIKKETRSKLSKNASYAHIFRDNIFLFYSKIDKQGITTEWIEQCPNDIKIRLQYGKNVAYEYLYMGANYVNFINDINIIEYYPDNNSSITKELNINVATILLHLKKGIIQENKNTLNGKSFGSYDLCLISTNNNEFFNTRTI